MPTDGWTHQGATDTTPAWLVCVNTKYVVFQTLSPYVTVSYHAGSTETVCCVVLFREGDESAVAGARLGQHTADMWLHPAVWRTVSDNTKAQHLHFVATHTNNNILCQCQLETIYAFSWLLSLLESVVNIFLQINQIASEIMFVHFPGFPSSY